MAEYIARESGVRDRLSRREREVFDLMARGMTNREIAELLALSENTVKVYVRRTFTKLDVSNRTEAVGLYGETRAHEETTGEVRANRLHGRERELTWLERAFQAGAECIAVEGLAGVGKTALALAAVERLAASFPDGSIRILLGGASRTPPTPAEAMRSVLRAIDPGAPCPHSAAEVASLYERMLRGRRALLVLDDAAAPAQIDALQPPPGSAVLVTSRLRMALPETRTLRLGPLPDGAAAGMLLELAPRAACAAAPLATACGGLPLALVMAARTLTSRPDIPPQQLVEDLRDPLRCLATLDQSDPEHGVGSALSASLDALPEAEQRAWARLGSVPRTLDRGDLTALWGTSSAECDLWLGRLLRHHLIEWEGGVGEAARYHMHPLVHAFARTRLDVEPELRPSWEPRPLRARVG